MSITAIDPHAALVVIDLQQGIVANPAAHPVPDIVARAAALATAFRGAALPVVLVNVAGGAPGRTEQGYRLDTLPPGWTEVVPELERQPQDIAITKHTWGAFTGTGLEAKLRGLGVTQVVLAGIASSIGVESTARQAHELGFHVALATDAMTDRSPDAHRNSVERIFPRLSETGTTQEILALLHQRAG